MVNNNKGIKWFKAVNEDITYIESNTTDCLQPNLQRPTVIHPKRDDFEKDYIAHGFVYVAKKYGDMGWKTKIKDGIIGKGYRLSKRIAKKLIK